MIYNLTEKLTFANSPKIKVKDKVITVKADAPTVLKVMDIVNGSDPYEAFSKAKELLFSKSDIKVIDSLELSMADFITFMQAAMSLAVGENPDAPAPQEQ